MKLRKDMERHLLHCSETRRMSPNTIKSYEHAVRRFVGFMESEYGVEDSAKVTKNHILEYLRNLSNSYAPSSATQHFTIVHVFFNFLEDYGVIEESPFRRIHERKIKIPKRLPTTLTIEEVRDILVAAYVEKPAAFYGAVQGEDMLHYRDCLILEVLFNTGMRVHELCGLKTEAYDEKSGIITLIGKGNKERKCYLTASNLPDLYKKYMELRNAFLKQRGNECRHIFINRFGTQLSEQGVRDIVTKYSKKAGITKNVTPHVFRHSFATLLMEQGVNLRYIQEYLGHETILTTQRYLHISDKEAQRTLIENHPRAKITPEMFDTDENEENGCAGKENLKNLVKGVVLSNEKGR